MQKKSEKIILTLYLLGFLALALTIALLQPLANTPPLFGNPPDEHARYLIPQFICRYGRIPTGLEEEVRIPAYGFSYALYNVFPYIVQGYIMRFVSLFTESEIALLYTARLVNVTFGLLMAVVVYFIGKRVFQDARFRWLFCFAVTYLPEGLFSGDFFTAKPVYAYLCEYGFLLHAVHGDDGICAGLCLQGRHQRPEQPVDERRYYFMRTFLL